MYHKHDRKQLDFGCLYLPFGGKFWSDNRWVILTKHIFGQQIYSSLFSKAHIDALLDPRIAIEALVIKERFGVSDRETVEQIRENPYLQYVFGLGDTKTKNHFIIPLSMTAHFWKRLNKDALAEINESIIQQAMKQEKG